MKPRRKIERNPRPLSVHLSTQPARESQSDDEVEQLVDQWLSVPQVATLLEVPVTKVRQLLADCLLVGLRRGENNAIYIPARLLVENQPLPGLAGVLTVLVDGGFTDLDCVRWLFSEQPGLDKTPVQSLTVGQGKAVRRIAQACAW